MNARETAPPGESHYSWVMRTEHHLLRRGLAALAVAFAAIDVVPAVTEPAPEPVRLGLYEWMGTAPLVVEADVLADDGKFVQAIARSTVKGDLPAGTVILVDVRQANKDRETGVPNLDVSKGRGYLMLLKPSSRGRKEAHPVFDLVRGARGARVLPPEGRSAVVDAATRLGRIQERNADSLLWSSIPEFLEDPNPVLLDAALELTVKFRRETVAFLPVLEPLLEHPRPDVRLRAAVLVGRILERAKAEDLPERGTIVGEMTGRARRDDDPAVRKAATEALARIADASVDETLRTIAQDDADQDVRLAAVKALFDRKDAAAGRRSD